ncbi:hypothetical protein D9M70_447430 [compost metagenome]
MHDVEHRLDQLLHVALQLGQAGVVVAHDFQPVGKLGQHHRAHPLQHLVDVQARHDMRMAVRLQQPVHQCLQAIRLLDDDLRVFAQRALRQLELQQLRGAADAAERVLDLVRQVADQFLVGRGQVEDALLAVAAHLLLVGEDLHHHGVAGRFQCSDHYVRMDGFLQRRVQHQVLAAHIELARDHGVEHAVQLVRVAEQVRQRQLHHAPARHAEGRLGGGVGVDHAQAGLPHQQHRVGDHVKTGMEGHHAHGQHLGTAARLHEVRRGGLATGAVGTADLARHTANQATHKT